MALWIKDSTVEGNKRPGAGLYEGGSSGSEIDYGTTEEFEEVKDSLPVGASYYITDDYGLYPRLDYDNIITILSSSSPLNFTPATNGILYIITHGSEYKLVGITCNNIFIGACGNTNNFIVEKGKNYSSGSVNISNAIFIPFKGV